MRPGWLWWGAGLDPCGLTKGPRVTKGVPRWDFDLQASCAVPAASQDQLSEPRTLKLGALNASPTQPPESPRPQPGYPRSELWCPKTPALASVISSLATTLLGPLQSCGMVRNSVCRPSFRDLSNKMKTPPVRANGLPGREDVTFTTLRTVFVCDHGKGVKVITGAQITRDCLLEPPPFRVRTVMALNDLQL